jgi:ADP-dependent NAD(P)H-hydrate dehydratase / NAD(P)H-hydrate epimerase
MKIFSAPQIRAADAYTIANEPIPSIDLMERASREFSRWFLDNYSRRHSVHIFCGSGNNGGDGLAVARMLHEYGYRVSVYLVGFNGKGTTDFLINKQAWEDISVCNLILHTPDIPSIESSAIIIDALFGSGLNKPLDGIFKNCIQHLNDQPAYSKIAIDIPSGLPADGPGVRVCFEANFTLSFELPKLAFFAPEHYAFVGRWKVLSIGLSSKFIEQQTCLFHTIEKNEIRGVLKKRELFAHKGHFGHVLISAGSFGKIGAAVLAARAALQSGVGLLSVHIPACGYQIMQKSVAEAMCIADRNEKYCSEIPDLGPFSAIALGPGWGQEATTKKALQELLDSKPSIPLICDADALNLLADMPNFMDKLPAWSILSPHPGEFKRLFGDFKDSFERWKFMQIAAKRHQLIIILKGAHTAVALPDGTIWFNTTGNPGMATGGSGDVLTGLIVGFLAQGIAPSQAALLGVWLHGHAGDLAAVKHGQSALSSGQLVELLSEGLKKLENH